MTRRSIELEGGKYTVIDEGNGQMRALRNGEPWRDLTGDKMIGCLLDVIEDKSKGLAKATPWRVEEMGPHFRKLHLAIGGSEICLHHFTGPDLYEPHDHPYAFTTSILAGGYVEEVWTDRGADQWTKDVVYRHPGTTHRVEADTVHRIIRLLGSGECITSVIWHTEGKKRREPRFWRPWETPTRCRLHNEPDNWVVA